MLVRVQRGSGPSKDGLSGAEQRVVDVARSMTGKEYKMPGLLLANVNVAERGDRGSRQVDGILISPHGLVVLEVKGFTRTQPGTVHAPLNGTWTVDGQPAAIYSSDGEANPLQQVQGAVYAVKNALTAADVDPGFVVGLVVLVGRDLRLTGSKLGNGFDLVLGTRSKLRRYLHEMATQTKIWDADRVIEVCKALQMAEFAPDHPELLDPISGGGFPELLTQPRRQSPLRPESPPPPHTPPGPTRPPQDTTTRPPHAGAPPRSSRASPPPPRQGPPRPSHAARDRPPRPHYQAATRSRAAPPPRRRGYWILPILLMLFGAAATTVAAIVVYQAFH